MLIRQRIYLILFLVSLLPLILVSFLGERISEESMKQLIVQDFQVLAREKATEIGRHLDERINETRLLSNHPAIVTALQQANTQYQGRDDTRVMKEIHQLDKAWIASKGNTDKARAVATNELSLLLRQIQARRPSTYGEMFVTDRLGATVAMTKTLTDYYQADEYWWQATTQFVDSGAFLDDRGYDESVDAIVVGVVVPVVDQGKVLGTFKINFRVKAIIDIVSADIATPGYTLTLARSDGSIITSNDSEHPEQLTPRETELINTSGTTVWEGSIEGKHILTAHYPMKHTFRTRKTTGAITGVSGESTQIKTWFVIHNIDQSVAFSPLQQLRNTEIALGLVAIILATIFGFWLSRAITQPLSTLRSGTEMIGKGNLSHRIKMQRKDEFGSMASSFNAMTQRLQETLASRDELNREVAERRLAQQEMARLQEYLKEVLDAMPSIVVGVDNKGLVTHWNREASQFTGIEAEQADSRPVWEILPILSSRMSEVLVAITEGEALKVSRMSYQHKGEQHYADVLVYPLKARDIEGAVIRFDDVTERTHMEEMMVQTEKMLSVGGLAGGMAHELNNPIGGMVQGIQNIRRRLSPEKEKNIDAAARTGINLEQLQKYLAEREVDTMFEAVANAGDRASDIVNNMLRFSRKSEMAMQAVQIDTLLDQTVELAAVITT